MCEHLGIFVLTGQKVKDNYDSAIKEHLWFCNYVPDFKDFSNFAINNNDFNVMLIDSLLFKTDNLSLNKSKQSLPLKKFW